MANIYMGRNSCYAINEGIYVAPGPMDLGRIAAHLLLHLRDLRRGWTYDHDCNRVAMDRDLFETRSKYLVKICRDQGLGNCDDAEVLINEVISTLKLPKWAEDMANKYVVRVKSIIDFSR
ncbi:hypothetical protein JCM16161A_16610 [Vulcanisaeta sp. JCM 16161]|uniref:hypothetical protein n=1 Tax=Vulcanisaeta sp. JCM 16161 TaxID=1295372 RepID=UPI0006D16354|nr:hypothetical protein [Vulcanisaeta sp. JCM 16161]